MRKQWFGDSRDYVKWDFVLAESQPNLAVVYIAMARPDEIGKRIHPKVRSFFDKYKNLELAGEIFDGQFIPLLRQYQASQCVNYFDEAESLICGAQHSGPVVVFLDPDTGVEPRSGPTDKHVRLSDIRRLAHLLRSKDKLIVYQHAPIMRKPTWIADNSNRIAETDWFVGFLLRNHHDPDCASDVCFLVIEKP